MSSALPLIDSYVCTKFNFNPLSTFQDMARSFSILRHDSVWTVCVSILRDVFLSSLDIYWIQNVPTLAR